MIASPNLRICSILLLFLSTLTTAWPWPRWLPEVDALIVRQNSNQNPSITPSASQSTATQTQTPSASPSGSQSSSQSQSQSQTSTQSQSQSASYSISLDIQTIISGTRTFTTTETFTIRPKTSGSSAGSHTETFAATLPAGGITLVTPAVIAGAQYYKIGDNVTFVWNYTNVLATPTAVNVLATCTLNQQMYTMAANHTVGGNSTGGSVTWDTGAYQSTAYSDPLLTAMYTLVIYDAASSISDTAQPGYLAPYEQYSFGMYTPQPYTPLPEWTCTTCSGALTELEQKALTTVVGVSIITVLSFTWFVGGLGVIW